MAITVNDAKILFLAETLGVSFEKMLTLGRMELYVNEAELRALFLQYRKQPLPVTDLSGGYAEPFYNLLGAASSDSIDFSDYEKASIIHDMNVPVPASLYFKYSVVLDGGTIEHVFNFPQAIKNAMEMIAVGGHYIGITPANNLFGHGFYQFSPELYYRIFSDDNGFRVKKMLVNVRTETISEWYEVADPAVMKERVILQNNLPVHLVVIAEKTAQKNIFGKNPQQSDYSNTWNIRASLEGKSRSGESGLKLFYRRYFPKRAKIILHNLYDILYKEKAQDVFIGEFNPVHFKKVEI